MSTNEKIAASIIAGAAFIKAFSAPAPGSGGQGGAGSGSSLVPGIGNGYVVKVPAGVVSRQFVNGVGTTVTAGDGQTANTAYNVIFGDVALTAIEGSNPRVPPASATAGQFWAAPSGGPGAMTARRIVPVDIPGVAVNIATFAGPILDLTNLVGTTYFEVMKATGAGGAFWRIISNQAKMFITYNASTANGTLWTKDNDTLLSEVFLLGSDSENYWNGNNDTAAHTWTSGIGGTTQFGWRYRAVDGMFHIFLNPLSGGGLIVYAGGTVNGCTAGQVVKFPMNFGYIIDNSAPTLFTVTPLDAVNVTGTPTVDLVTTTGARLNVTATAAGTVHWVGLVLFRH